MVDSTEERLRRMADMATPMSIRVAATLKLPDHIGSEGATAAELVIATQTSMVGLVRVLDHLVTIEVLSRIGDRYHVTALGAPLRERGGDGLRDDLDINSWLGRADLAFTDLLYTATTGAAAYPQRYGISFFDDHAKNSALQQSFDAKMVRRFREQAPQIAQRYNWSRFTEVVDVGGGRGVVLIAILQAHAGVRGRLLDLPPTAARAEAELSAAHLEERATAIGGSYFDPLPLGADAYILSDILHNWDDERAHLVLARCAEAAGPNGSVIVIEPLRGRGSDTAIDLAMLVFFGGRERTSDELAELAAAHGLVRNDEVTVADGRTLLEFVPA